MIKHTQYLRVANHYTQPSIKNNAGEYCTENGALKIASQIRKFWAERGYKVNTWIEPKGFLPEMRGSYFDVRSNMVNGLPVERL